MRVEITCGVNEEQMFCSQVADKLERNIVK